MSNAASIRTHSAPGMSAVTIVRTVAGRVTAGSLAGPFRRILGNPTRRSRSSEDVLTVYGAGAARFGRARPSPALPLFLSPGHIPLWALLIDVGRGCGVRPWVAN